MRIFNTLTRQKEEFIPSGDTVKMYVCGVTPYDDCHLGHAMSYIIFDVIRRYLEYLGYQVQHVQNFTDIDDKTIARSQALGISTAELTERHIHQYFIDMDALNVQRAHHYPWATKEIPKMLEVVEGLVEKGYAYERDGDVYFRITSFPDYGKLSHRTQEGMMAGARVEVDVAKEHPMDFVLWKAAKPGEPAWDSPWGPGRPGWHIECSAMCLRYLGETVDIHGGGLDLVFPHHENEIAQSEAFTGVAPFARYWLHNGLLQMGADKMSKSLGNLVPVREALQRFSADAIRLFCLSSYYRGPLTYSEEGLAATERGAERLRNALRDGGEATGESLSTGEYRDRFIAAMDDDFNTPQAISHLFDLAREINRGREQGLSVIEAQALLRELAAILGLTLEEPMTGPQSAEPFIVLLVETRAELRAARQFELADRIRARLAQQGIVLEDGSSGTRWRYQA